MNAETSILDWQLACQRSDHLKAIRALPSFRALPPVGARYVDSVLLDRPARAVGQTSLLSVSGACFSRRFPFLVEFESAGCEKPYILHAMIDDRVLDLLSQPTSLTISKLDRRGRIRPSRYTADFLEITAERISLVEAKPQARLRELASQSSDWYESDGSWHFLPAEQSARRLGLSFRVFCPESLSSAFKTNLQIISRFSGDQLESKHLELVLLAREYLVGRPASIAELCSRYNELTGAIVVKAIEQGLLHGLLEYQQIEPDFMVYASSDEASRRREFVRNASLPPRESMGLLHKRLLRASAKELEGARAAMERYDLRRQSKQKKNATDYRDDKRLKLASQEGAPRVAAFVRHFSDRGSRERRISSQLVGEVKRHALNYLRSGGVPNTSRMYADFISEVRRAGGCEVSAETYRKIYLSEVKPETVALEAGGKRAFHAARPRTDGAVSVPRPRVAGIHVHLDGVYGDARAEANSEGEFLRPIFFPLVDDATGYVLGVGVQSRRPSRLPVLMAHRDCYLRHGFLPGHIIQDWGSEFVNLLIPEMRGQFGVSYSHRPKAAARFGGIGEMFNAQFNAYLQELAGGTYFDKAGRSADGQKKSRATAKLTVREIVDSATDWIFNVWNLTPFGSRKRSPSDMWSESIACFPEAVVSVNDDALSRYYTSLPLKSKKFSCRTGYRYAGRSYMSQSLPSLIRAGETPTNPRLDCMNPSIIHAMTSRGPIEFRSLDYQRLSGLTFDRLVQEMDDALAARTRAKFNQMNRNILEAEKRHASRTNGRKANVENRTPRNPGDGAGEEAVSGFDAAMQLGPTKLTRIDG